MWSAAASASSAVAAAAIAASGASAWPAPSSAASPPSAAPPEPDDPRTRSAHADAQPSTPEVARPCRRADPNLGACVRDSVNAFIHHKFAGVPESGSESFDPSQMPYVNSSDSVPGNMTLNLSSRAVNVRGFSKANIIHVRANPEEQKSESMSRVPWLTADGVFSAAGNVLSFPISAQGAFSVNMTEVSSSCIVYFSEQSIKKGGPKYFTVDHLEFDFTPVDVSYNFGDTLDEDNQLGEAMNLFLNTNAQEVFGDAKGRVTELSSRALRAILDTVMEAFPADSLSLPD